MSRALAALDAARRRLEALVARGGDEQSGAGHHWPHDQSVVATPKPAENCDFGHSGHSSHNNSANLEIETEEEACWQTRESSRRLSISCGQSGYCGQNRGNQGVQRGHIEDGGGQCGQSNGHNGDIDAVSAEQLLDQQGITIHYVTDRQEAADAVSALESMKVALGLDIETAPLPEFRSDESAGLDPYKSSIRLIQVYGGGDAVYVFDVHALGGLEVLAPLWRRPLVVHNAVFELKYILHAGGDPKRVGCTMLQANALEGGLASLARRAEDLLGWKISKEQQTSDWAAPNLSPEQLAYAALDAVVTRRLFVEQDRELRQKDLLRPYALMRDAQRAVARLELNGLFFDVDGHADLLRAWQADLEAAGAALREHLGPDVNPDSVVQLSAWLEANLDAETLSRWPRTRTGKLKTGADTLALFDRLPLVQPLLAYKDAHKKVSTYGNGFAEHVNPVTGRVHGDFRLGGTRTGRFSCSKPNVQNPPRDPAFRALFSAHPGRVLVVADYGQIELRVAAIVSGDAAMLAAYENGEDLHRKTAAAVAGVDPADVSKGQRQEAKAINFGLLYGQGPSGLARYARTSYGVEMGEQEAAKARRAFYRAYPDLRLWQRNTSERAKRARRVGTPAGRVRDFSKERGGYKATLALNTPIQGGAAEVMLAALANLDLSGLDAKLVNIVHDELVVECAEASVPKVKSAVEQAMVQGMLAIFPDATTDGLVEATSGTNWAEAK